MLEYIKSMLEIMPDCVTVFLPEKLQIEALENVAVMRHDLNIVEYRDSEQNVLMRHTVLGDF